MLRLTLRTLLAYLDDTLDPASSRLIGQKVTENPTAQELVDRIKKVVRKRGLSTPPSGQDRGPSNPNTVAEYLSDALTGEQIAQFEMACLESDVHLAEVAAVHQILTLVLSEPTRVSPVARLRMYGLVKGKESIPGRLNGGIAPVGGTVTEDPGVAAAAVDDEVPLLGGGKNSSSRLALTALGAAVLAAGFMIATLLAFPTTRTTPDAQPVAAVAPTPVPTPPPPKPKPPEKPKEIEKPKEKPGDSEIPPPREVVAPAKEPKDEPKPPEKPKVDLGQAPAPPRADKVPLGRFSPDKSIVFKRTGDEPAWARVTATEPAVTGSEKLMALPGYKGTANLDAGVVLELWGNLPEFLAAPLFACSVTPSAPPEGFAADLTVHGGRIYLTNTKADPAKVRLRFGTDQIWDVALPDKSTVAFEVQKVLATGTEPPQVRAAVAHVSGPPAALKVRFREIPAIQADEAVFWDSKAKRLDGPRKPDPKAAAKASQYFQKVATPTDATTAKATTAALDDLAKRLTDATRSHVTLAESLQNGANTAQAMANARVAVAVQAALGDLPALVDDLGDSRSLVREAAVVGLQQVLAADPKLADTLPEVFADKARLTPEQATTAIRLLRGLTEADRTNPATVDRVIENLAATPVCLRELSFFTLMSDLDPDARTNRVLSSFDAGGPPEQRELCVKAWKRRGEELKKKLEE